MSEIADKERYIYNYLNNKSTALSFYAPRIVSPQVSDEERGYYIERVKVLVAEIIQVLSKMEITKVPINSFFNELYILVDCNIPQINSLLEKYGYQDVIKNEYIGILRKVITKEPLNDKETLCCEFLLAHHLLNEECVFEYFIRGVLIHAQTVSYDAFEQLFIDYTKMKMRAYVHNPKCELVSEKYLNGKESYSIKDIIYLCREDIASLYYTGNFKVLKNMLHELGHVKQFKQVIIDKNSTLYAIRHIKEEILAAISPGYYDDNYERISYEVDAEIYSILELLNLFEKFGITFKVGKNPYKEVLANLVSMSKNNLRVIDGTEDTVDNIFDFAIIHYPEFLEIYPQLQELYEVTWGDIVVRKDDFGRKD